MTEKETNEVLLHACKQVIGLAQRLEDRQGVHVLQGLGAELRAIVEPAIAKAEPIPLEAAFMILQSTLEDVAQDGRFACDCGDTCEGTCTYQAVRSALDTAQAPAVRRQLAQWPRARKVVENMALSDLSDVSVGQVQRAAQEVVAQW
jgi:hypothetical protein